MLAMPNMPSLPSLPSLPPLVLPDLSDYLPVAAVAVSVAILMVWCYIIGRWNVQEHVLDYLTPVERELIETYRKRTRAHEVQYVTLRVQRDAEQAAAAAWQAHDDEVDGDYSAYDADENEGGEQWV